jgi:hypothetical protein
MLTSVNIFPNARKFVTHEAFNFSNASYDIKIGPSVPGRAEKCAFSGENGNQAKYPTSWGDAAYRHKRLFMGFEG